MGGKQITRVKLNPVTVNGTEIPVGSHRRYNFCIADGGYYLNNNHEIQKMLERKERVLRKDVFKGIVEEYNYDAGEWVAALNERFITRVPI